MNKSIALFSPTLSGGGSERVILNLAYGFVDEGYEVDLVLSSAKGEYLQELDPRVKLVDLGAHRVATSLPALLRYLYSRKPTALLSTQGYANVIVLIAGSFPGIRTRLYVRDTFSMTGATKHLRKSSWTARIISWLAKRFYRKADGVVAVCNDLKPQIAKERQVPDDRITVIYNPVQFKRILRYSKEPTGHKWFDAAESNVVLSIGRLEVEKDFKTLIHAFSLVRNELDTKLVILGDGELRPALNKLAQTLGLSTEVDLPGFVDNPYSYLARADVFALSSLYEGLPNVLLEALALGTPIVATDCDTGPREILREGRDGVLVPVGNPNALAKGIIRCLVEKNHVAADRESLGRFDLERVVRQYIALMFPDAKQNS